MAKAITTIPRDPAEPRVETGPIQFGNDWPGVFLRGDDAFAYASAVDQAQRLDPPGAAISMVEGLARTLRGCVIGASSELILDFSGIRSGLDLIRAERFRQTWEEGWTPEHDDTHVQNELADAAAAYATSDSRMAVELLWPWAVEWWKPTNRLRDLVKAGALIAAEIDRRLRAGETP